MTIIHSTSLPSNTQSPPPPLSIEPDSQPNLKIVTIVSVVVATGIILILVIAILVTFMCVKNKRQPTLRAVCDANLKSTSVSRNPMKMSCDYDESVELKFNSSHGVVSPKPLKNVATSPHSYLITISQTSYGTMQDNSNAIHPC